MRGYSDKKQWYYVPMAVLSNADVLSRGLTANEFLSNETWTA